MVVVQAGGIIVWRQWVVLRRTANSEWVFPKGWIDPGETSEQAAIREVREETGIRAEIVQSAGEEPYEMDGEIRDVAYYLMHVLDAPEWAMHGGLDAGLFQVHEVNGVLTYENNRSLWGRVTNEVQRMAKSLNIERNF